MIAKAEIFWHLSDFCDQECSYCPPRYRGGSSPKPIDVYVSIIKKIQDSRYKFAESIVWQLSGGEPLSMPSILSILKKIKEQPSYVKIETSGGNSWFDYMSIQNYIDQISFTYHHWQNPSIAEYIIDFCQTNNKVIKIKIPYYPGKVKEQMALMQELESRGLSVNASPLYKDARSGNELVEGYSKGEINLMEGRPEDWEPPPPPITFPLPFPSSTSASSAPPVEVTLPDPNWKDPNIDDGAPKNLGHTCYAGVDYLYISHKGYVNGSDCGARSGGNVYEPDWQPLNEPFACPMFFCRSTKDKQRIRIIK